MPDYAYSKIYKIYSPTYPEEEYVGSTTQTLSMRMMDHRSRYKTYLKTKKCPPTSSYKLLEKYDDCIIKLICKYPCNNRQELREEEGRWIRMARENGKCVNRCVAGRKVKQYKIDNKEIINEKRRQHYGKNKEIINEKRRQCYERNKEKINQQSRLYYQRHKEKINERSKKRSKERYKKNKEVIKLRHKKYREVNREWINEKAREKVKCVCGSEIRKSSVSSHKKTNKHQKYLSSLDTKKNNLMEI